MSKTAKTVILFVVKLVIVSSCWTTFSLNRSIYCSVTVCKFDHKHWCTTHIKTICISRTTQRPESREEILKHFQHHKMLNFGKITFI